MRKYVILKEIIETRMVYCAGSKLFHTMCEIATIIHNYTGIKFLNLAV